MPEYTVRELRRLWTLVRDLVAASGGGGGGGAPTDAQYVVMAQNSSLSAEVVLYAGAHVVLSASASGVVVNAQVPTLAAGTGISLTISGSVITVASSGGGGLARYDALAIVEYL